MNDEPDLPLALGGDLVLYRTEDGRSRVSVRFDDQTVWLTQADIAELFQTTPQNIAMHLAAIYEEGSSRRRQLVRITYKFDASEVGRSAAI